MIVAGGFNKSMLFAGSLGIGLLDRTLSNILNAVSNTIAANNSNPLYSRNLYDVSSPMVRIGNNFQKSGFGFW